MTILTCERCSAVPAEPYMMDGREGSGILLCDGCIARTMLRQSDGGEGSARAYLRTRGMYEPGPGLSAVDMLTPAQCIEVADEAGL